MPQKRHFFVAFQLPQNRHFVHGDLNQVERLLFIFSEAEVVAGLSIKLVNNRGQQPSAGTGGVLIGGHVLDLDPALSQMRVDTLEVNFLELD